MESQKLEENILNGKKNMSNLRHTTKAVLIEHLHRCVSQYVYSIDFFLLAIQLVGILVPQPGIKPQPQQ